MPQTPRESFFLWGSRQVGKSTWLRHRFPDATWIDLLDTEQQLEYRTRPALLRERLAHLGRGSLVVIDEVQKVPALLDEVQWLIEGKRLVFGLSGSSARKVRRGHANLLGGRALRLEMYGLVSAELGKDFELTRMLNHGYLPRGRLEPGGELFGKAFENWICHELHAHREYSGANHDISYWRLPSGIEVDFLLTPAWVAVEAKAVARASSDHLRGLRELALDQPAVKRRILVCLEKRARRTEDGIEVMPYRRFAEALWAGELA